MYVPFDIYEQSAMSDLTEDQYRRVAPVADSVIDHWTLDRVGRAVGNGEALPDAVVALYCAIVDVLPDVISQSRKAGKGGLITSFSNGVDSFSFDPSSQIAKRLHDSVGWMLDLLPVEWSSGVVSFDGGAKYVG